MQPLTLLAYGFGMMLCAMAAFQPIYAGLAFACVSALGWAMDGTRSFLKRLAWQVPIILVFTMLNGAFVRSGATIAFSALCIPVSIEALAQGLVSGAVLACTIECAALISEAVSSDDAIAIFGNRIPTVAVMVGISLKLIPGLLADSRTISDVRKASTAVPAAASGYRFHSQRLSTLMASSIEDSMVTADSMRARGWSSGGRRTFYMRHPFTAADWAMLAFSVALFAFAFASEIAAILPFSFFPIMSHLESGWIQIAGYALFAIYMAIPLAYALRRRMEGAGDPHAGH